MIAMVMPRRCHGNAGIAGVLRSKFVTDHRFEDATALAAAIAAGELSPLEAVGKAAARVEALNGALNAVIHLRLDEALDQARSAAGPPAAGAPAAGIPTAGDPATGSPLAGVPIAIKDLGCEQKGEPHHRGAKFLAQADWRARKNSHLFELLSAAGTISIGRTNTPEFGSTITTEPLSYGPTANPWNLAYSAGGSSGGSAAAVAAGIVPIAHGNDGGGSIRIPASACGLVGLKPSRGRVSTAPQSGEHRGGLAVDGMLTRTVRDAALCLGVISVPAVGDPYPAPLPLPQMRQPTRLRIATYSGDCSAPVQAAIQQGANLLADLGHEVVPDRHPNGWFDPEMADQLQVVRTIGMATELADWSRLLGRPIVAEDVEPTNWWSAELGQSLPGTAYVAAQDWLALWRHRVMQFWHSQDGFDLLLTPVLGDVTPSLGYLSDPVEGPRRLRSLLGFVDQANVSGQPAIALPTGQVDAGLAGLGSAGSGPAGMPIGVQLIAALGAESLLLDVAQQISDADGFIALPDFAGPDFAGPDFAGPA